MYAGICIALIIVNSRVINNRKQVVVLHLSDTREEICIAFGTTRQFQTVARLRNVRTINTAERVRRDDFGSTPKF